MNEITDKQIEDIENTTNEYLEIAPKYELNNEYDKIKNRLQQGYIENDYKIAQRIIKGYKKLPEYERDIFSEEKYLKLLKFTQEYNLTTAKTNLNKLFEKPKEPKEIDETKKISQEIIYLLAAKKRAEATETIVNHIKNKYNIHTTRDDDKPEMWIYQDGIYLPNGRSYLKEIIREILEELHTTHLTNEIIYKIEADTFINQKDFFDQQNQYKELIPVQNGILNIKTKELKSFSPKYYFFNKINATYKKETDCPSIKQFIKDILPDENSTKTIQELIGFCLLKEYRYERSFMFLGKGSNGKTKLLDLIKKFLGQDNILNISLTDIEKDYFSISELHNKLANISGEISKEALNNTGTFKDLTGRGTISASRKFKTKISFENYAKMIFATNELPKPNDTSEGFWRRWVLLEFPFRFLPQKEINLITDKKELEKVKLRNTKIIEELTTQEELNGLLNFALEGFERLEKNKEFSYNQSMKKTEEMWLRKSNSLKAFIMDHIQEDYDARIEKKKFKEIYHMYCKKHKIKPETDKMILHTLTKDLGAFSEKKYVDIKQFYVWTGIKFKNGSLDDNDFSFLFGI